MVKVKRILALALVFLFSLAVFSPVVASVFSYNYFEESAEVIDNFNSGKQPEQIFWGPHTGAPTTSRAYSPLSDTPKNSLAFEPTGPYSEDTLLIKIESEMARALSYSLFSSTLLQTFQSYGVEKLQPVFNQNSLGGVNLLTDQEISTSGVWYKATPTTGTTIEEAFYRLSFHPQVIWVEPDYLFELQTSGPPTEFTDPDITKQWHLEHAGVKDAWDFLYSNDLPVGGSREIIVAIIDTGVDYTHPDLVDNMWVNPLEHKDGTDTSGNGFIDDIHGANIVSGSGSPMDDHGHGTHVAGIIAAVAHNQQGGVGVAFNIQIMAIKAGQADGLFSASDIAKAVYYAVENGADIVNMSFGGYGKSAIVEEALALAYGSAVLVAAAGNDGIPNESLPGHQGKPLYPAAYPWVLGVMASAREPAANGDYLAFFSNWDATPRNAIEYELMAPGVDIFSTFPDNRYATWSGTSVAAPVVSGMAALLRTHFDDKNLFSSRFIMGQLSAASEVMQGITPAGLPSREYNMANAHQSLINSPDPDVRYVEHYIFDTKDLDDFNNEDGIVDAGETIAIGMVLRNHWGKADDVEVSIEVDPAYGDYVDIIEDTINYGSIGSFSTKDNGFIYDEGVMIGVEQPFIVKIAPEIPNDSLVTLAVTITSRNGYNPENEKTYSTTTHIGFRVRRGVELPRIITEDMILTKEHYWVISDMTLIEEGVTVTVEPGTQIQFWSMDPSGPYAEDQLPLLEVRGHLLVNGTLEEPVELITGRFFEGYDIRIYAPNTLGDWNGVSHLPLGGYAEFSYVKIMNPRIVANKISHCYFRQVLDDRIICRRRHTDGIREGPINPIVRAHTIEHSRFYNLGTTHMGEKAFSVVGELRENLFDGCFIRWSLGVTEDNVFLNNYKIGWGGAVVPSGFRSFGPVLSPEQWELLLPSLDVDTGKTYFVGHGDGANVYMSTEERWVHVTAIAEILGGSPLSIRNAEENQKLLEYLQNYVDAEFPSRPAIGLQYLPETDEYRWINGDPLDYSNWFYGYPQSGSLVTLNFYGEWIHGDRAAFLYEIRSEDAEPALITQEDLDDAVYSHVKDPRNTIVRNNAFLNIWWNTNIDEWMRFFSSLDEKSYSYLSYNYWGTTSRTLINLAIHDKTNDWSRGTVIYEPIHETAPASTYPFVAGIVLKDKDGEAVTQVGAETIQIRVTFNRDMNTDIQPQVGFGPAEPFTDFTIEGEWITPRVWQGEHSFNFFTGDGYHYFRVENAVAADNPWLVTGNDKGRFRFEVMTAGAASMPLQATGGEGFVQLNWNQEVFDLLAGYNVYRSEKSDGQFSRVNSSLIPREQQGFRDTSIVPGTPYYYKFTLVHTNLNESAFSDIAMAVASEKPPTVASRLSGPNRYSTAVAISQEGWADGSQTVVLARADDFADALAGVPLAHYLDAPILLTATKNLHWATKAEIQRLNAEHVILLGGTGAISEEVRSTLESMGVTVERISGANRYGTAAEIANRLRDEGSNFDTAFIAVGTNFADALAASAYAAINEQPILLTQTNRIPIALSEAISSLGINHTYVVGGQGVISNDVFTLLPNPRRISGSNRYGTAVALAEEFLEADTLNIYISTGLNFPDAIAGGVLAAKMGSGVLLVRGDLNEPNQVVKDFLADEAFRLFFLFGGQGAISVEMEEWFSGQD